MVWERSTEVARRPFPSYSCWCQPKLRARWSQLICRYRKERYWSQIPLWSWRTFKMARKVNDNTEHNTLLRTHFLAGTHWPSALIIFAAPKPPRSQQLEGVLSSLLEHSQQWLTQAKKKIRRYCVPFYQPKTKKYNTFCCTLNKTSKIKRPLPVLPPIAYSWMNNIYFFHFKLYSMHVCSLPCLYYLT